MRLGDGPFRSRLLEVMNDPLEWLPWTTAPLIGGGNTPDSARLQCQTNAVRRCYFFTVNARDALKLVVAGHYYFSVSSSLERYIENDGKHKARYASNPIADALKGVDDLRYIRRCAVCEKFFYARRITSMVCDPKSQCAGTYAKRNERANAKRRAESAPRKGVR
jgi:hypothetical protein